jgi:hypothetical protein
MKSSLSYVVAGASLLFSSVTSGAKNVEGQEPIGAAIDPLKYKAACPDYKNYAMRKQYVRQPSW